MRNVLKILKRDLLRLLKTPQALVVVFALMVIPSLYTWYNVIGFWNPYDNTGNLTVCVVNQDAGGSSELTGELNVGERIVDQLHENDQLHWEFTDYDAAMNELKSGRAYAAYVIPEHFTADLLTLTTGDFTQPKIEYYVNEKSGPVAPKITDTGATTLDETINSTFVATVSDVVVKTIDEKVNEGRENTKEMQSKAAQKVSEAVAATALTLRGTLGVLGVFSVLALCLAPLLRMAVQYLFYQLAAFFSGMVGSQSLSKFLEQLSSAFSLMLAMTAGGAFLLLVSLLIAMMMVVTV